MSVSGYKLYQALIEPLRAADQDLGNKLLERYLTGPQTVFESIETEIQSLLAQKNPATMRADLVPYLKDLVGFTSELKHITDRLTTTQLRRLVQLAVPLWNQRHTERGLINAIRLLTGRTAVVTNWFGFRWLLGETFLGEDQLATGGDSWIVGGATSQYDEQWSNVRVMDDGTLDELLLVDVVRLMRPHGERVELFLPDFLDKFDVDLARWNRTEGAADATLDTATQTMVVPSGTEMEAIVPIFASAPANQHTYTVITKFNLAVGAQLRVRWYVDGTTYYQLEIQTTAPRVVLTRTVLGTPTVLVSTNPTFNIVSGVNYKLRFQTINQGQDRLIRVYIDNNLVVPTSGSDHNDNGALRPTTGTFRFRAVNAAVTLDNVESWRIPGRYATITLSTPTQRGGLLTTGPGFIQ